MLILAATVGAVEYPYDNKEPQKTGWPVDSVRFPTEQAWLDGGNHWPPYVNATTPVRDLIPQFPNPESLDYNNQTVLNSNVQGMGGNVDVILIGDSITQQWMHDDWTKANIQHPQVGMNTAWKEKFGSYSVVNLGIGGDKVEGVLWRLDHDGIKGVKAKVVVLCIGTNDVGWVTNQQIWGSTKESLSLGVAKGIKLCAQSILEKMPGVEVVVCKVLPAVWRNVSGEDPLAKPYYDAVVSINAALDTLNLGAIPRVHVLDCRKMFLKGYDPSVALDMLPEPPPNTPIDATVFRPDEPAYVHITLDGYRRWARILEPTLKALITPAPTITSLAPISGTTAGGTKVTITGTNLTGTSGVTFDGTAATLVTVVSATSVTCVTPAHAVGAVNVVLTATGGPVTSTNGYTYTAVAPTITTQPQPQTVTVGQSAEFTVVATGSPTPTYQWLKNGAAIAGATSASYNTPMTTLADNGARFSVVVTNTADSVTSSEAVLTVTSPPVTTVEPTITMQPRARSVTVGRVATFTVSATGKPSPSCQWFKDDLAISGATSASYTTPVTVLGDSGAVFSVVVSNSAGSVTSSGATLTVTPAPLVPVITTQPANQPVTVGQTATFTVVATGTPAPTYQWFKDGTAISGATATSYTTPVATSADHGGVYSVVVSNSVGSETSVFANLSVVDASGSTTGSTASAENSSSSSGCGIGGVGMMALSMALAFGLRLFRRRD